MTWADWAQLAGAVFAAIASFFAGRHFPPPKG